MDMHDIAQELLQNSISRLATGDHGIPQEQQRREVWENAGIAAQQNPSNR
jgi:hypothetical protein